MKPSFERLLIVAAVVAGAGCFGTDTGNPYTQPLTVDAHSSDPGIFAIAIPQVGGGVVTEVWLSLNDLAVIPDRDPACAAGEVGTDDVLGFGVADHAAPGGTSVDVTLEAGDYCTVAVPFALADAPLPAGAPPELAGASIVLIGTTAADFEFIIASALEANITLTGPEPLAFNEDLGPVFLGFDVASWLAGIDIDGAVVGTQVVIDANNNADLLAEFEANVAGGIELYRDIDGNGQADPGDELLASGQ